jgi:hypothetical protein
LRLRSVRQRSTAFPTRWSPEDKAAGLHPSRPSRSVAKIKSHRSAPNRGQEADSLHLEDRIATPLKSAERASECKAKEKQTAARRDRSSSVAVIHVRTGCPSDSKTNCLMKLPDDTVSVVSDSLRGLNRERRVTLA